MPDSPSVYKPNCEIYARVNLTLSDQVSSEPGLDKFMAPLSIATSWLDACPKPFLEDIQHQLQHIIYTGQASLM